MKVIKNLIVFEGIDGCGKTTQVVEFAKRLQKEYPDYAIVTTAEPSKGCIGRFLREEVLSGKSALDAKTVTRLFAADREQHLLDIRLRDNCKALTVCDRYVVSNIAYQSLNNPELEQFVIDQNEQFEKPFLTVYLRVEPEKVDEVFRRVCTRSNSKEIFDKLDTQKNLARNFDKILDSENFSKYTVIVDATQDVDTVAAQVWTAYTGVLEAYKKEIGEEL